MDSPAQINMLTQSLGTVLEVASGKLNLYFTKLEVVVMLKLQKWRLFTIMNAIIEVKTTFPLKTRLNCILVLGGQCFIDQVPREMDGYQKNMPGRLGFKL